MRSAHSRPVQVAADAPDAISCAGITEYLMASPQVEVLPPSRRPDADVVVWVPEPLTPQGFAAMADEVRGGGQPTVLVADRISEVDLHAAARCGTVAVLPTSSAADERLLRAILAAAARKGAPPPDLLELLSRYAAQRQSEGEDQPALGGLELRSREIEVLRLMAEGLGTEQIAQKLCYSQRTIKQIFYSCTRRLNLRNRPHAVAYAMRRGAI